MRSFHILLITLLIIMAASCRTDEAIEPTALSTDQENQVALKKSYPTAMQNAIPILGLSVDAVGNQIIPIFVPPSTPLYYARTGLAMLGPDGSHITAGEFLTPSGTLEAKCIGQGTQIKIHLTGLIPNATYRVWLLPFKAPGFDLSWPDPFVNLIGSGAVGPNDRSQNTFHASASGKGTIVRFMPGGNLSGFGSVGDCLITDVFEWHVFGAFQQPGQAGGTAVGSPAFFPYSAVEQFVFVFK